MGSIVLFEEVKLERVWYHFLLFSYGEKTFRLISLRYLHTTISLGIQLLYSMDLAHV